MRALLQRVSTAQVQVAGETIGQIEDGLLILICAMQGDTSATAVKLASSISKLRIFGDQTGKMNLSLAQTSAAALVVSQFTLAADTSRGNRPGFSAAANPEDAKALYLEFAAALGDLGIAVETGRFGAETSVSLTNEGPVTIWLDTQCS